MAELVGGEHFAPASELSDALARIWRRRPEHNHGMIENREREPIRDVEWILDHDLNALRRRVSDETGDGCVNSGQSFGDELRPSCQLRGVVDIEAAGVHCVPVQPRSLEKLRLDRSCRHDEEHRDHRALRQSK